ncbi:hypothetical protein ACHAWF_004024 [Thalassiosira exigua]
MANSYTSTQAQGNGLEWKHGVTRDVVQKADPDLAHTVVVNTKFPQFGSADDVAEIIAAGIVDRTSPHKLGGPFYTSVPSERVQRIMTEAGEGREREKGGKANDDGWSFNDDDEFGTACAEKNDADREMVWNRIKRLGRSRGSRSANSAATGCSAPVRNPKSMLPKVGISRLHGFLDRRVDECYRCNVVKIVSLLKAEYASAERRLHACERELEATSLERLRDRADTFCDDFYNALRDMDEGSIVAPAESYAEMLEQDNLAAGSFSVSVLTWERFLQSEVGNTQHRLYGGSQQSHRLLHEFNLATRCLGLPTITDDEIANAADTDETYDSVNFLRAACVIALEKAHISFDPLLDALGRLCPVGEHMIRQKQERRSGLYGGRPGGSPGMGGADVVDALFRTDISHTP